MALTPYQISLRLLELKQLATPIEHELEQLSEELRAHVQRGGNVKIEHSIPGWGKVSASAASERKLKGSIDVLDLEAFAALPAKAQAKLRKMGLVKSEQLYSQARKSAVSVTLDIAAAAASLAA